MSRQTNYVSRHCSSEYSVIPLFFCRDRDWNVLTKFFYHLPCSLSQQSLECLDKLPCFCHDRVIIHRDNLLVLCILFCCDNDFYVATYFQCFLIALLIPCRYRVFEYQDNTSSFRLAYVGTLVWNVTTYSSCLLHKLCSDRVVKCHDILSTVPLSILLHLCHDKCSIVVTLLCSP